MPSSRTATASASARGSPAPPSSFSKTVCAEGPAERIGVAGGPNPAFLRGTSDSRLALPFILVDAETPASASWYDSDGFKLDATLERVVRPDGLVGIPDTLLLADDDAGSMLLLVPPAMFVRDDGRDGEGLAVDAAVEILVLAGDAGRDDASGARLRGEAEGVDGRANAILRPSGSVAAQRRG